MKKLTRIRGFGEIPREHCNWRLFRNTSNWRGHKGADDTHCIVKTTPVTKIRKRKKTEQGDTIEKGTKREFTTRPRTIWVTKKIRNTESQKMMMNQKT